MNKVLGYVALVLATLTGVFLLWQFRGVVTLFLFALALAAAMRRPIDYLVEHKLPRGPAIVLTYLLTLGLLGGLLYALGNALIVEGQAAGKGLTAAWEQLRTSWPAGSPVQRFIAQYMPQQDEIYQAVQGALSLELLQTGLGVTLGLFEALSQAALVLVLSIYWSIDRYRFERLWLSMLQAEPRIRARTIWQGIEEGVGAYLRSTAVQLVASGLLFVLGYRLLGLDTPATLALLAAVAGLIPLLGSVLAVVPALLVGLIGGPLIAALAALYTFVVLVLLRYVVRPRLLDRRRYNPMLTVIVMLALGDSLGIFGLLLAVPLAAVIEIVLDEFLESPSMTAAAIPAVTPFEQHEAQIAALQDAVAAGERQLSSIQISLVDRLTRLTAEAADVMRPPGQDGSATRKQPAPKSEL